MRDSSSRANSCTDECLTGSKVGQDPNKAYSKYGMPWGVGGLTEKQRFIKAVDAGVDQFGGTFNTGPLIEAVKAADSPSPLYPLHFGLRY